MTLTLVSVEPARRQGPPAWYPQRTSKGRSQGEVWLSNLQVHLPFVATTSTELIKPEFAKKCDGYGIRSSTYKLNGLNVPNRQDSVECFSSPLADTVDSSLFEWYLYRACTKLVGLYYIGKIWSSPPPTANPLSHMEP
ncbi:hypothetical protein AC579_5603 [Pseudocercospora musae]|uniref:Uncharacterized protein n=1 Tax=Pseudocercospora musae TaxID=113226 RepID=A0A139INH8_9PEZI|nr:hypothetical protein AC579_5603 [Pseudocercospora musae]